MTIPAEIPAIQANTSNNDDDDIIEIKAEPSISRSASFRLPIHPSRPSVNHMVNANLLMNPTLTVMNGNEPEKILCDLVLDGQHFFVVKWRNSLANDLGLNIYKGLFEILKNDFLNFLFKLLPMHSRKVFRSWLFDFSRKK